MFHKRGESKIYILNGVEDYLTESAKKHKRNLMFLAFFIMTLTAISLLNGDLIFKSAFGFSIQAAKGEGINSSIFLIIASIACVYEIMMLLIYKKQCDSHFFGKQLNRTDKTGSSEQLDNFKRVIELINYDIRDGSDLNDLLDKHLEQSRLLLDMLKTYPTPTEVKDQIIVLADTIDEVRRKEIVNNAEYAGNAIFDRVEHLMKHFNTKIDDHRLQEIRSIIMITVMERIPKSTNAEQIVLNFFNNHNKIVDLSKGNAVNNEAWKARFESKLQENLNKYEELTNLIKKQGSRSKSIVFAEIFFPIAFGVISVACAYWFVVLPYLDR